ncbi:MAG TPA: hypothetical protein PKD00_03160 [Burkholderiales bacterium]|nr:hypothetical protein [Burkholderiales bacterium]
MDRPIKRDFPFKIDWTDKQFFIYACFVDDLQSFYKDWIEQKRSRKQFFYEWEEGELEHLIWSPSKICSESREILTKENIDIRISYWSSYWFPIHKDLKVEAAKQEAFECQKIDTSCNDCKFLDRPNSRCKRYNRQVQICPNTAQDHFHCFEHRKS